MPTLITYHHCAYLYHGSASGQLLNAVTRMALGNDLYTQSYSLSDGLAAL